MWESPVKLEEGEEGLLKRRVLGWLLKKKRRKAFFLKLVVPSRRFNESCQPTTYNPPQDCAGAPWLEPGGFRDI